MSRRSRTANVLAALTTILLAAPAFGESPIGETFMEKDPGGLAARSRGFAPGAPRASTAHDEPE